MKEATAYEFSAIRNYPHVEVQFFNTKRTSTVLLSYMGRQVGEKFSIGGTDTYQVNEEMLAKALTPVAA